MKTRLPFLACAGLLASTLVGCGKPEAITPTQLTEQNKPGTVLIHTNHKANFSVPDYSLNEERLDRLVRSIQQSDEIQSQEQAFAVIITEVLNDPLKYFIPSNDSILEEESEITSTGSGLVVTEDGYVVTNAHVVSSEQDDVKEALALQALEGVATNSCKTMWNGFEEDNFQEAIGSIIGTQEFVDLCLDSHLEYYAHYMELDSIDTEIHVALGATARDSILDDGYKATVKAEGEPAPGKDVAILKIEADNMPTVALGDDADLAAGDRIFILGYPGASVLSDEESVEASLTAGLISARKAMPDGWDILQTDAAMSNGNSGGPVFNEDGEVIGIATFARVDPTTGNPVQGANFVIPMHVISEFLNEADVEPMLSPSSELYQTGIQQFEREQFQRALETFRSVSELNPDYPYVQRYLTSAQDALRENPPRLIPVWVMVAGGTALLVLGVGGAALWRFGWIKLPVVRAKESL